MDPERDVVRERLALALLAAGEVEAAEDETRTLIGRIPGNGNLINMLGVIQKRRGRIDEALETFRRGTELDPNNHSPWYNLGNTLLGIGKPEAAVAPLQHAVRLAPREAEALRVLGQALLAVGRTDEAIASFDQAQALDPKNLRIYTSRAAALQHRGSGDAEIIAQLDAAIGLEPDNLEHRRNKAVFLQRRSRYAEAEAVHREVLALAPDDLETLLRLGHLLGYSLRRYEEANEFLRHALELHPDDPRCLSSLCKSLIDSRYGNEGLHIDEAARIAHRLMAVERDLMPHAANLLSIFLRTVDYEALERFPDRTALMRYWVERMNVGSLHNQLGRVITHEDRLELVSWHREWGRRVTEQAARTPIKRPPTRTATRDKIRVGMMSSDLRDHPVAYFALPIFENYNRDRFEFYCYSFYPAPPDRVQSLITQRVKQFRSMLQAQDQEIAQQIADDELDILFELGGSTRYNRLEVMAYHAAPVQVSWLGYPHSAGIEAIDHILVDPYLKPDDRELLIEKPFELPESWVVLGRLGFRDEPIEAGIPEDRSGFVTFGTMNNPYKYTRALFKLWAEVMQRVENSRFLFVRPEAGTRASAAMSWQNSPSTESKGIGSCSRRCAAGTCRTTIGSTLRSTPRRIRAGRPPAKRCGWACLRSRWSARRSSSV